MQYTGTDRVYLYVCRKSCPLTHLHVLDRVAVALLPIVMMKSNGDFAASRLQDIGLTTTLHVLHHRHVHVIRHASSKCNWYWKPFKCCTVGRYFTLDNRTYGRNQLY